MRNFWNFTGTYGQSAYFIEFCVLFFCPSSKQLVFFSEFNSSPDSPFVLESALKKTRLFLEHNISKYYRITVYTTDDKVWIIYLLSSSANTIALSLSEYRDTADIKALVVQVIRSLSDGSGVTDTKSYRFELLKW